jgi:hypothetical protein
MKSAFDCLLQSVAGVAEMVRVFRATQPEHPGACGP